MKKIPILFAFLLINLTSAAQSKQNHQFVFTKDKNSKYYKEIQSIYKREFERNTSLSNVENSKKWIQIFKYNNKFYLYKACDIGYVTKIQLTNKLMIWQNNESITTSIKKIETKNSKKRIIYFNDKNENHYDKLNIISLYRNIFKLQLLYKNQITTQIYLTPLSCIKQFELIVNQCQYAKIEEFKFEK